MMRVLLIVWVWALLALPSYGQQSMRVHSTGVMHAHEGAEMAVKLNSYVEGAFHSTRATDNGRPVIYIEGDTLDIHPTSGDMTTVPLGNKGGEFIFTAQNKQILRGGATALSDEQSYLPNLTLDNPSHLHLQREAAGTVHSVHFIEGKLVLDSMDFVAGTRATKAVLSGHDHNKYFVTNGTVNEDSAGFLIAYLDGTSPHWPIGQDVLHYNPAMMSLTSGAPQQMKVRVWSGASTTGFGPADISTESCGSTWDIVPTETPPTVDLSLAHDVSQEGAVYAAERQHGFISHHVGYAPNTEGEALSLSEWDLMLNGSTGIACEITSGAPLASHAMHTRSGISSFSPFSKGLTTDFSPLPVELLSFDVEKQGEDALLLWSTATEVNNAGFDIEHSLDGMTFNTIGFEHGAGNSSSTQYYNHTHLSPGAGVHYYRLRQVDFNGDYEYSPIRVVDFDSGISHADNGLMLYPNPAEASLFLALDQGQILSVLIYDLLSNKVMEHRCAPVTRLQVPVSELARGSYMVLVNDDASLMARFVKH